MLMLYNSDQFAVVQFDTEAREHVPARGGYEIVDGVVLRVLHERQINEVQVEAGATLAGAWLQAGLVDEVLLYIAPVLLGERARPLFHGLRIDEMAHKFKMNVVDSRRIGDDLRVLLRPEAMA